MNQVLHSRHAALLHLTSVGYSSMIHDCSLDLNTFMDFADLISKVSLFQTLGKDGKGNCFNELVADRGIL